MNCLAKEPETRLIQGCGDGKGQVTLNQFPFLVSSLRTSSFVFEAVRLFRIRYIE